MTLLYKIIICFFAGMGAGLGTGFAGMSAAAVITPMLVTFLKVPPYQAVGVALASDVLASAASAYTYGKNRNLDVRNGLVMMGTVLALCVLFTLLWAQIAARFANRSTPKVLNRATGGVLVALGAVILGVNYLT